ncbi:MAG: TolC family outer membrane protein [Dongiaceae bacterium]
MRLLTILGLAALVLSLAAATPAAAQQLLDSLATAYANNPQLRAARAQLRAVDEQVPQALSGWRPTIAIQGQVGTEAIKTDTPQTESNRYGLDPRGVDLTITQPLYQGGRTVAATSAAENNVRAQRALLLATEQSILLSSVQAYMDVVRDTAVLQLTINNEQVLRRDLEATRDRFNVGEVTRTDVAQAEAALALAIAQRIQAAGNLTSSRARYTEFIGDPPVNLVSPPPPIKLLPANEGETVAGSVNNPDVISAQYVERAARDQVDVAFGQMLPSASLVGTLSRGTDTSNVKDLTVNSASIIAQVTIPLYQAGNPDSQVRQAKQTAGQRRLEIDQQRRSAVQNATTAWQQLSTARSQIVSFQAQVKANTIALEGVRQEAQVGARTVLDVLDAEQTLLQSQVNLVGAQHDEIVACYSVLAAVGRLTARNLGLKVSYYDPESHYKQVRDKWWGIGGGEKE